MVYTEHAPTAAVLDGTSYATTKERTTVPTSCCVTVKLPVVIISVAHDKHSGSAQKQRTLYLPLALWLDAKRCLTSAHINKNYIRWLGGNSSTLGLGEHRPPKYLVNCTQYYASTPLIELFQTVTSASYWISPQRKPQLRVTVTSRVWENLAYSGSLAIRLATKP